MAIKRVTIKAISSGGLILSGLGGVIGLLVMPDDFNQLGLTAVPPIRTSASASDSNVVRA